MAVQNFGAIMQGAADLTAMPANAFAQGQQRRQQQEYRNALLQQDQQAQAFQQQKYMDAQAQADEDDAEGEMLVELLRAGKLDEAAAIDPGTTQAFMQAKGIDPQTVLKTKQFETDSAFEREKFAADQAYRNQQLALQRQQEARLARGGDDEFARYAGLSPEQRDLYDRMKGRKPGAGGVTVGPDGQLMVTPDPSKATEGERVSANYLGRMEAAEKKLGDYTPGIKDFAAARTVMSGNAVTSSVANKVLSKEGQRYYQAAADWVRAKLRKESGAVISPQEMEQEIKTYFPIPGDDPETVKQKTVARQQAMEGMRGMGGRAVTGSAPPKQGNRVVNFEDL